VVGLVVICVFMLGAVAAPVLAPHQPWEQTLERKLEGPSRDFPLGTDELGRCILSRILYGGRLSLAVGFVSVAIGLLVGGGMGLLSGYFGGPVDAVIMRVVDVLLAFPSILLAIAIAAILGPGLVNVIIAVGVRSIPSFARMMRGAVLVVREKEFCEAARALGAPHSRILGRTVLPNIVSTVLVFSTLQLANAILLGGVLNFIGLGVRAPTAEWGKMVADGRGWLATAPHVATFPGLAIFLVAMAFNLVGDGLRDSLDPRLRQ
jgi:ABC-type dipeptide/oligopeptide/nickel transport system permease subunit